MRRRRQISWKIAGKEKWANRFTRKEYPNSPRLPSASCTPTPSMTLLHHSTWSIHDKIPEAQSKSGIHLPLELVQLILDRVDNATLRASCLVSRIWCFAAQPKLFSSLSLDLSSNDICIRHLDGSPHLREYVRRLTLSTSGPLVIQKLLSGLSGVQELYIDGFLSWGHEERQCVAVPFIKAPIHFLQLQNIRSLDRATEIPALVSVLPDVTSLGLLTGLGEGFGTREAGLRMRDYAPGSRPRRLREIRLASVDRCVDLLLWLTGPAFDLSSLHVLHLAWNEVDGETMILHDGQFGEVDELLGTAAPHVRHLSLTFPVPVVLELDEIPEPRMVKKNIFDLLTAHLFDSDVIYQFRALETLTFRCRRDRNILPLALFNTVRILAAAPPFSKLRHLAIHAGIKLRRKRSLDVMRSLEEWSQLDVLLSNCNAFPLLKTVTFAVKLEVPTRSWVGGTLPLVEKGDVYAMITGCLPRLREMGLLEVD